jgi:hypothetical protein
MKIDINDQALHSNKFTLLQEFLFTHDVKISATSSLSLAHTDLISGSQFKKKKLTWKKE